VKHDQRPWSSRGDVAEYFVPRLQTSKLKGIDRSLRNLRGHILYHEYSAELAAELAIQRHVSFMMAPLGGTRDANLQVRMLWSERYVG